MLFAKKILVQTVIMVFAMSLSAIAAIITAAIINFAIRNPEVTFLSIFGIWIIRFGLTNRIASCKLYTVPKCN